MHHHLKCTFRSRGGCGFGLLNASWIWFKHTWLLIKCMRPQGGFVHMLPILMIEGFLLLTVNWSTASLPPVPFDRACKHKSLVSLNSLLFHLKIVGKMIFFSQNYTSPQGCVKCRFARFTTLHLICMTKNASFVTSNVNFELNNFSFLQ